MKHFRIGILTLCFMMAVSGCASKKADLKTGSGISSQPPDQKHLGQTQAQPSGPTQPVPPTEPALPNSLPASPVKPVPPATPQPSTPGAVESGGSGQVSKPTGAQPPTQSVTASTQSSIPSAQEPPGSTVAQPGTVSAGEPAAPQIPQPPAPLPIAPLTLPQSQKSKATLAPTTPSKDSSLMTKSKPIAQSGIQGETQPASPSEILRPAPAQAPTVPPVTTTRPAVSPTLPIQTVSGTQPPPPSELPKPTPAQAPTVAPASAAQAAAPSMPPSQVGPGTQIPAPLQPSTTPIARPPVAAAGPGVIFNFDNADIYEVIRVMAEIMKVNYLVDPKVKGTVNIHTTGQLPADEVFPIFQSILRLNGATAVKKGGLYEIVPLTDAKKTHAPPTIIGSGTKVASEERYTIQILSLKYIPVTEASKLIKPFLSDGADIVEHPPHNILIISDVASNVRKSLEIISLFDIDIFTDTRVRIYPVLNADVTEIAKEMERIFSSFEVSTKSGRGVGITFTPVTRINSLLVVSSIPNIFEKVEGWLRELDRIPGEGSKLSVFVYYVQNAKAKDLAEVLKEVFTKAKEKKGEKQSEKTAPAYAETGPKGTKPVPPAPPPPPTHGKEEAGGVPEGEIGIVVDEPTNSLIIKAFQRDYRAILDTIKKLDIYPKQVLIETLMAEIKLDEENKFGIEWAKFTSSHNTTSQAQGAVAGRQPPTDATTGAPIPFDAFLPQSIFFRYAIVEFGGRLSAAIDLAAAQDRVKVISSPHIIASNNKEAKIQVGSSQPILTNTYTTPGVTSTTGSGVVEGTIEYKDIGIIVSVTPRISDGGLVTLEISIENSDVQNTSLGNLATVPAFPKKTAKTIVSVMEGQTIVMGGLISETKEKHTSGVPLLSKIPILGAIFGFQTYQKKRNELILMMTPHIIRDQFTSDSVTSEFKEKVEGLKKQLGEKEKKEKEIKKRREKTNPNP